MFNFQSTTTVLYLPSCSCVFGLLALSVIDLNLTLAHFNLVFTTDQGTFSVVWAPGGTHWAASPLLGSFGCEDILIVGVGVKPDLGREARRRETAAYPRAGHPVSESSLTHVCSVLSPPQLSIGRVRVSVTSSIGQDHVWGHSCHWHYSGSYFFEVRFHSAPQAGLEL